ncbi:MAG: hypothetical protein QNJ45_23525 [Ardenticatenaceae bacterium]|nr:hypothetical protein [Ardenticatenaceae bacterium]
MDHQKPSGSFYIFLIFIVGLVQLSLIQIILEVLSLTSPVTLVWQGIWFPIFLILAYLVYRRRFSGYVGAMVAAAIGMTQLGLTTFQPELFQTWSDVQGTPLEGLISGSAQTVSGIIFALQFASYGGILLLGFFYVPPDFATKKIWHRVNVPADLYRMNGAAAHLTADRLAQEGQWAMAVMYWRRALADDPSRVLYALSLADAYRRLGFEGRAIDILKYLQKNTSTMQARHKIAALKAQTVGQWRQKQGTLDTVKEK